MKKIAIALIAAILLFALTGCGSGGPDVTTPTTIIDATTAVPLGETKIFERKGLSLEITNVASVRSDWYPFDGGDDDLNEVVTYTLYPGAQLTVLNVEYDSWQLCVDIPWEDGRPPSYVKITRDMPPMELTPEILSVSGDSGFGILSFEWTEET